MISDGWKLIVSQEGGKAELFHLSEDLHEERNLAVHEPDRVQALRHLMLRVSEGDNEIRVRDD